MTAPHDKEDIVQHLRTPGKKVQCHRAYSLVLDALWWYSPRQDETSTFCTVFFRRTHVIVEVMVAAFRWYAPEVDQHRRSQHHLGRRFQGHAGRNRSGRGVIRGRYSRVGEVPTREWVARERWQRGSRAVWSRLVRSRSRASLSKSMAQVWCVELRSARGSGPTGRKLSFGGPTLTTLHIIIHSLLRTVLIALVGSTLVGTAPRGALARRILHADSDMGRGEAEEAAQEPL